MEPWNEGGKGVLVIDLKMSEVEVEFDAAHDGWRVWVDGWVSGKWFG